jgi:hypothetical protein
MPGLPGGAYPGQVLFPLALSSSTSYTNPCGSGDRRSLILITPATSWAGTALTAFVDGNTTTNAASTLATLQRGGTSCDNPADKSAYWAPALISPSGQVIVPQRISAYYVGGNLVGSMSVMPYPSGLKIVAGGDTRNFDQAGYSCTEGNPISSVPLNCGNGANLRAIIIFPSCWDGVHTDSTDHRSHMAYPNGRGCPAHFPVLVPKLGLRVKYPIGNARGYGLSSDMGMHMTNGMSLHADFFNAWDPTSLAHLVACLNGTTSSSCSMRRETRSR